MNMALDEALFESVAAGDSPPILRIYGWQPPCVSLGRFQPLGGSINRDAIQARGYDLVRRPTGGRAIIHRDEVTYSVAIRCEHLTFGQSVMRSYRELSAGVACGLERLGLRAGLAGESGTPHDAKAPPAVCFAKAAAGDMAINGRKIVGSAQMRRGGTILQHGSIPLHLDGQEHAEILGAGDDPAQAARRLSRAAVGVADALGREVSFDELGQAVVMGFSRAFGVAFADQPPTKQELERAAALMADRYANDAWTLTPENREVDP